MPPYMLECFDQKGIKTESRSEIMFTSSFMQGNNLMQYSKLFYKMSVRIELPLKDQDLDDFKVFCKINKYLKTIHVNKYNRNDLEKIIEVLKSNKLKNIKIYIHDNITKESEFNSLKKLNSKHKKDKIKIELKYSDSYLEDNLFKQIVINVLKVCGLISLVLVISFISYVGISNYRSTKHVNKIKTEIKEKVDNTNQEELLNKLNEDKTDGDEIVTNGFVASLLEMNPQSVGWLKVNNTNIDYPVVQGTDNKYYLDHNYSFEEDNNGWVFMDYRDDSVNLSQNTIIYAHNRYYSGVMFGTLYKVYYSGWYNNKQNQIIQFDTLYGEHKWKVFSIYKIPKTNDYLQVKFDSKALNLIVTSYARESGVRNLEKCIDKILRKYCTELLTRSEIENNPEVLTEKLVVTQTEVLKYLSKPVFNEDEILVAEKPGTSLGLAWTSMGGDTLLIESIVTEGKGGILITGQLGDVMKESANIAYSLIKQYALKNGIKKKDWFEKNTIHLHFPEGATPKDGPSAGITIATALLSLLKGKTIKKHYAMTGELSLTGKVLAIGGLREKTVAAKRNKITDIIIPKSNERDLEEIPEIVKKGLVFHPVSRIEQVWDLVF